MDGYCLVLAAGDGIGGVTADPNNFGAIQELNCRLVSAAAARGLCEMSAPGPRAAQATINWLVGEGLPRSTALWMNVADAIDRLRVTPTPLATDTPDKVTWAISLIHECHGNVSEIARKIDIPRSSIKGRKWARFNQMIDEITKKGKKGGG